MAFSGLLGFAAGAGKSLEEVADARLKRYHDVDTAAEREAAQKRMEERVAAQAIKNEERLLAAKRAEEKYQQDPEVIQRQLDAENARFGGSAEKQIKTGQEQQQADNPVITAGMKITSEEKIAANRLAFDKTKAQEDKTKDKALKETEISDRVKVGYRQLQEAYGMKFDAFDKALNPDILKNNTQFYKDAEELEATLRANPNRYPHEVIAKIVERNRKGEAEAATAKTEAAKEAKKKEDSESVVGKLKAAGKWLFSTPEERKAAEDADAAAAAKTGGAAAPAPAAKSMLEQPKDGTVRQINGKDYVFTGGEYVEVLPGETREQTILAAAKERAEAAKAAGGAAGTETRTPVEAAAERKAGVAAAAAANPAGAISPADAEEQALASTAPTVPAPSPMPANIAASAASTGAAPSATLTPMPANIAAAAGGGTPPAPAPAAPAAPAPAPTATAAPAPSLLNPATAVPAPTPLAGPIATPPPGAPPASETLTPMPDAIAKSAQGAEPPLLNTAPNVSEERKIAEQQLEQRMAQTIGKITGKGATALTTPETQATTNLPEAKAPAKAATPAEVGEAARAVGVTPVADKIAQSTGKAVATAKPPATATPKISGILAEKKAPTVQTFDTVEAKHAAAKDMIKQAEAEGAKGNHKTSMKLYADANELLSTAQVKELTTATPAKTPVASKPAKTATPDAAEKAMASLAGGGAPVVKAEPKKLASGQIELGNIDVEKIVPIRNKDGSYSTVASVSMNFDNKEVLFPRVVNGRLVSVKEAAQHYRDTGEHLGKFKTPAAATAYAQRLHETEAARVTKLNAAAKRKQELEGFNSGTKPAGGPAKKTDEVRTHETAVSEKAAGVAAAKKARVIETAGEAKDREFAAQQKAFDEGSKKQQAENKTPAKPTPVVAIKTDKTTPAYKAPSNLGEKASDEFADRQKEFKTKVAEQQRQDQLKGFNDKTESERLANKAKGLGERGKTSVATIRDKDKLAENRAIRREEERKTQIAADKEKAEKRAAMIAAATKKAEDAKKAKLAAIKKREDDRIDAQINKERNAYVYSAKELEQGEVLPLPNSVKNMDPGAIYASRNAAGKKTYYTFDKKMNKAVQLNVRQ